MTLWPGNFKGGDLVQVPDGRIAKVPLWEPKKWGMPTTSKVPVFYQGLPLEVAYFDWFTHTELRHWTVGDQFAAE